MSPSPTSSPPSGPPVVWITGRPASGKTTLGRRLVAALSALGRRATLLDSDEIRATLTPAPTYSDAERLLVYRAIALLARTTRELGAIPVVAATAHDPALRDAAKAIVGEWLLVHARCPLEVCEARDPKGLYRRARASAEGTMPGVHVPWTDPEDADVVLDTSTEVPVATIDALVSRALDPGP